MKDIVPQTELVVEVEQAPTPSRERYVKPAPTYRETHTPNRQQQAERLEYLRVKHTRIPDEPFMQRLGDYGRSTESRIVLVVLYVIFMVLAGRFW